jgi:hypothetical protein
MAVQSPFFRTHSGSNTESAMSLRELWFRFTTTRYTRSLEREVARLRAENRALLNSILGIAGVPPLPVMELPEGVPDAEIKTSSIPEIPRGARGDTRAPINVLADGGKNSHGAAPLRRRSWQQINRMLEFESARRKAEA